MHWKNRKLAIVFLLILITFGVSLTTQAKSSTKSEAQILLYHHIANPSSEWFVDPKDFEEQMAYLSTNGYRTLTISEYLDKSAKKDLEPKSIVLTFDDGYLDNYLNAYPVLKKYGFKGTFYIITGQIGIGGYMTWAQLREMHAAGMEIGAHTVSHPFLSQINIGAAWLEVYLSKVQIAQNIGVFPATFAYPYNDRNPRVQKLPKMVGFRAALAVDPHRGDEAGNLFTIPRKAILRGDTLKTFGMIAAR